LVYSLAAFYHMSLAMQDRFTAPDFLSARLNHGPFVKRALGIACRRNLQEWFRATNLDLRKTLRLIRIAAAGVSKWRITGGEPLTRR